MSTPESTGDPKTSGSREHQHPNTTGSDSYGIKPLGSISRTAHGAPYQNYVRRQARTAHETPYQTYVRQARAADRRAMNIAMRNCAGTQAFKSADASTRAAMLHEVAEQTMAERRHKKIDALSKLTALPEEMEAECADKKAREEAERNVEALREKIDDDLKVEDPDEKNT